MIRTGLLSARWRDCLHVTTSLYLNGFGSEDGIALCDGCCLSCIIFCAVRSYVQLLEISYRYDIVISVAEFYAPRYGAVDADPSLPDQKLTLNWVYPFTVSHRVAVAFQ